jgi:hypothetical protein
MANTTTRTLVTGEDIVSIDTGTHTIEVSEGCLTIGENTLNGQVVFLSQEDTLMVLNALVAAENGYEVPASAFRSCGSDGWPLDM